ncbi:translocon-associated protein subunit gamma [Musca vetustissima]|uniref:translocon-associated protein subunit gamma n=1 Tax=Musca vetustissima TaxID=27455 RepID=UPI002AB786AA|nr:translocon-associated protein subunit gamma [Musca vetustissima]
MGSSDKKQQKVQSSGFTKEEELLLQDFSRNVSTKSSALFYGNAFIISAIPIWLFWRVHNMDLLSSAIFFVLMTGASTYLMAMAYKNIKFQLKHKIAVRREAAVTREINRQMGDDKKVTRKEKEERILWKKNEVADYEATTYSIFYNNALFLAITIFISFFLLKNSAPLVNYFFSIGLASGALALFSTSTQTN